MTKNTCKPWPVALERMELTTATCCEMGEEQPTADYDLQRGRGSTGEGAVC